MFLLMLRGFWRKTPTSFSPALSQGAFTFRSNKLACMGQLGFRCALQTFFLPSQEKDSNIANLTQKVESLEAELQDLSSQESKDEASLAKVRKQLRDLEAKVKDQEEELDEQAGTIQMLEQVRPGRGSAPCLQALALPVFWA